MTAITRRTALKAGVTLALTSHTPAVATPVAKPTIDEFLARATRAERVRYHSNELAEAMSEIHPDRRFMVQIDHDGAFAMIFGRKAT